MRRDEALRRLRGKRDALRSFDVSRLALFGSVARDTATPGSDVDILVAFERPVGLFHFIRLKNFLESVLGAHVDLATQEALDPRLRDEILQDLVDAA